MASIIQVNGKWRALVRRKGHKQQCKTFTSKAAAEAWARRIEAEIDRGDQPGVAAAVTVSELILAYRDLRERGRPIADTSNEHYVLKKLDDLLGDKRAAKLLPEDLVTFARVRQEEGAGAYTINMDISRLGTVYRYGSAALKIALPDVVGAARPTLTYLRLIGGGGRRERRPTEDEMRRLLEYFEAEHSRAMRDCLEFAALTAMRRGELTSIRWQDLDEGLRLVQVARKHPRKGKVIEKVPLLGRAWDLVQAQPRESDRIFPFEAGTLSKYFTGACRVLSIVDLHLHDLRHEGTSALFEEGYTIEQVALVTGHKDWRNLKRYTQLKPEGLHAVASQKSERGEGTRG